MPDFLRCFIRSRQSHRRIKAVSKTNSCTSLEKSKSIRLIILVIEKSARGSRQTRSIFPEDSITSVKANERKKRRSRSAMGAQEDKKHARSEETSPETPVTFLNPLSADRRIERSLKKKIKEKERGREEKKKSPIRPGRNAIKYISRSSFSSIDGFEVLFEPHETQR